MEVFLISAGDGSLSNDDTDVVNTSSLSAVSRDALGDMGLDGVVGFALEDMRRSLDSWRTNAGEL